MSGERAASARADDTAVSDDLAQLFETVRRDYFPLWRSGRLWTVRIAPTADWPREGAPPNTLGYCDPPTRMIWMAELDERLLIHELCHAVAGLGHGKRWRNRMRRAAATAAKLGRAGLASSLQAEAELEGGFPEYSEERIYETVAEVALQNPTMTLEAIEVALCEGWPMTVEALRQRAPRMREVFDNVKRKGGL